MSQSTKIVSYTKKYQLYLSKDDFAQSEALFLEPRSSQMVR